VGLVAAEIFLGREDGNAKRLLIPDTAASQTHMGVNKSGSPKGMDRLIGRPNR
jgi:hypothetical protein